MEHRYTKTKVIDIKKSESYGEYKAHCKSLEDAIAKEQQTIDEESKQTVKV